MLDWAAINLLIWGRIQRVSSALFKRGETSCLAGFAPLPAATPMKLLDVTVDHHAETVGNKSRLLSDASRKIANRRRRPTDRKRRNERRSFRNFQNPLKSWSRVILLTFFPQWWIQAAASPVAAKRRMWWAIVRRPSPSPSFYSHICRIALQVRRSAPGASADPSGCPAGWRTSRNQEDPSKASVRIRGSAALLARCLRPSVRQLRLGCTFLQQRQPKIKLRRCWQPRRGAAALCDITMGWPTAPALASGKVDSAGGARYEPFSSHNHPPIWPHRSGGGDSAPSRCVFANCSSTVFKRAEIRWTGENDVFLCFIATAWNVDGVCCLPPFWREKEASGAEHSQMAQRYINGGNAATERRRNNSGTKPQDSLTEMCEKRFSGTQSEPTPLSRRGRWEQQVCDSHISF